jgi:TolB-like protein/DNA-binding winged helix-turn-helix (wHTH) protein
MHVKAASERLRFAGFEVDVGSGELFRHGKKIPLQSQPFQVLVILLENAGQLVSREEFRRRLWPANTFVDFDHGLNKAVAKLREALSQADAPALIETLPRRGYRLLVEVETLEAIGSSELPQPQVPAAKSIRTVWKLVVPIVVGLAVLATGLLRRTQPEHEIRSLAVLPFENLSGDPSQEYFADGMTDELITVLARLNTFQVVSRTSAMQYKNQHKPLKAIADQLHADAVVEGSVARSGNRVRVTVQLIEAATDKHLWAEKYDRELSDILVLQNDLADEIADRVKHSSPANHVSAPQSQTKVIPEAHDAYLRGLYYWFNVSQPESIKYFEEAIRIDPSYAAAYSGLAGAYVGSAVGGDLPPYPALSKGEAAAEKGVELDPNLAEVHNSLAAVKIYAHWDFTAAEAECRKAITLDPSYAEAHHVCGMILMTLGRTQDGINEERRSQELDPVSRNWALGRAFIWARQFPAAEAELRKQIQAAPNGAGVHDQLAQLLELEGKIPESLEERALAWRFAGFSDLADRLRDAYARGGYRAMQEWRLEQMKLRSAKSYVSPVEFAEILVTLGRKEEAISCLEQALRQHSPTMTRVPLSPYFDPLHSDTRYQKVMKQVGFP